MLKRLIPLRRRCGVLRRHARFFSSSPSPPPTPSTPTFYDDLSLYLKRVVDRSHQLTRYSEHSVFPPSNWTLSNYLLYAQLQLPSKTEIDAVEFLTGARFACDRVIRAMHSQELVDYAADNAPRPQQADEMEKMFEPTCYQRLFLPRVRRLGGGVSSLQLTELDFTGVYLSGVTCQRTTRANLKAEETLRAVVGETIAQKQREKQLKDGGRPNVMEVVSDLSDIKHKLQKSRDSSDDSQDEAVVERLQLDALFHTTQTVEAVQAKTAERVTVTTDVKTTLSFESLVTEPEDVDWRIVKMNQMGRVVNRTKGN
ncbi:hypothetical protein PHYSODRAFT_319834 [Phytophthora sojae]|uniref:Uncharacterized protein n=1 Tax=Phytophthora sojae (strain P6497) TaxID=1094619 RepID=G5AE68_PHYSP|nr:hypothetical protein PHYSODRAFT_319834 [Phytophthora sojae]EGZ06470.1 hypothetical protein PHYSODRAFT_319834 [Phytophthora sojae]|eukprot:XP_009538367.1 hypothetical protein PHYSODRAFT_319834 [Phytophthora sojae]